MVTVWLERKISFEVVKNLQNFKFLHTADFHLNQSFQNNDRFDSRWLNLMYESSWKALDNIIEIAIAKQVDALIFTGDIFDVEGYCMAARRRFVDRMSRLTARNIKVYMIYGNHDLLIEHELMRTELEAIEDVYVFPVDEVTAIDHYKEGELVARIYGRAFKDESHEVNPLAEYAKVLAQDEDEILKIAMAHGRVGEVRSLLPCASFCPNEMQDLNIDYWAMGHVHKSKVNVNQLPIIVNPGSVQGGNIDELGSKGIYVVEFEGRNLKDFDYYSIEAVHWRKFIFNLDLVLDNFKENLSYDSLLKTLKRLLDVQLQGIGKPIIVQLIFEGKIDPRFVRENLKYVDQLREDLGNERLLIFEIIDRTIIELPDVEDDTYPIIKSCFRLIDDVIREEDKYELMNDSLVDLYGDRAFQEVTNTRPGQRGRGQWKYKKITSDKKRWLQTSKKIIANAIILSREKEEETLIEEIIQDLDRVREELFHQEKTITDLIEEYRLLKIEQEVMHNQIMANSRLEDRDVEKEERDLLIINQRAYRCDGDLFTAVRKWTVFSMAIWVLEEISKQKNNYA